MATSVICVMALGCLVDRLVFRPIEDAPALSLMISALAASIILQQIATLVRGTEARTIPAPLTGVVRTPLFAITHMQLVVGWRRISSPRSGWCYIARASAWRSVPPLRNRDAALLMGISMWQV